MEKQRLKWDILSDELLSTENIVEILLKNRGIIKQEEIDQFLNPDLSLVTPKAVGIDLKNLSKTITRITNAIEKKEQVMVYGDYDVDGITGAAILWEVLSELGVKTMPYLPHRVEEGYGLSLKGIDNLLEQYPETTLIITVDNGIVATEAVEYAKEKKIDVIITDHHAAHDDIDKQPKPYSLVHTTQLCGAGVAYLLAKELLLHFKKITIEDSVDRYLELATLGTVADLVPLLGANRTIVYHGLKKLCQTKRVGLQALFKEAGCDISAVGVYEIGFIIGPRLNAAGRLESGMDSLRTLCTKDPQRAEDLAFRLGRVNKERQAITFDSSAHAVMHVRNSGDLAKKILIVANESYAEGIIGLIAGRLVETFYRPAIVISLGDGKSKGSVRSISGFNIIEFLRRHQEYFINVGGHPMAAGFSIKTDKVNLFKETLEKSVEEFLGDELLQKSLRIDGPLSFSSISPELYLLIKQLSPFGMKNPEPLFLSKEITIEDIRLIGKEGKHLKLKLSSSDTSQLFEGVAFGMGEKIAELRIGDTVQIAYILDENTWNGNTRLQLKIKDIQS